MKIKYPSTPYFNKRLHNKLFEGREVTITEKRDGENNKFYPLSMELHARSIDSGCKERWRSYAKYLLSRKAYKLSDYRNRYFGLAISFENLYAQHSIAYKDLESPIEIFGAWNGGTCLGWEIVEEIAGLLEIPLVPILYKGIYSEKIIDSIKLDETKQEGYVVRLAREFNIKEFETSIAKYVRPNHIQTDVNWNKTWIKNTWKANEI